MGYDAENSKTGYKHQCIEYELIMTFDNSRSCFDIMVPLDGRVSDQEGDGYTFLHRHAKVNCAAAASTPPPAVESGHRPAANPSGTRHRRRGQVHRRTGHEEELRRSTIESREDRK